MKIFIAGAMFSDGDRVFNSGIANALKGVAEMLLPQDGPILRDVIALTRDLESAHRVIFEYDIDLIRSCDLFVICLDGLSVDEGAAFELGYAFQLGKQCVGILTDWRKKGAGAWKNPMLMVPLTSVFEDAESLRKYVVSRIDDVA